MATNEVALKQLTLQQITLLKSQMLVYKSVEDPSAFGPFDPSYLTHDYSSFKASNYLKFYQSIAYLLASQDKTFPRAEKLQYLQHSLSLLESIRFETNTQTFDLKYWRRKIIDALITDSYEQGAYFRVIKYAHMLSTEPLSISYLKLVAESYYHTKQRTRFQRLVLKYPEILEDKKLISKIKDVKILNAIKKRLASSHHLSTQSSSNKKQATNDSGFPKWKDFLAMTEGSFFGEHLPVFKKYINRYTDSLRGSKSSADKKFIKEMERSLGKLPPDLVLHYIRKMWHRQYLDKAVKASDVFLNTFRGHPDYSIVAYDRGRILEDQGSHKKAFQSFLKHEKWIRGTSHEENFDFRIAWLAYLSKAKQAEKLFESYLEKYPSGEYNSTCFYFLVDILKSKPNANMKKIQARVVSFIDDNPMNYYSLRLLKDWRLPSKLVLTQLGGMENPTKKFRDPNQIFSLGMKDQHLWDLYLELREFGLHEDAYHVLTELSQRLSQSPEWFAYSIGEAKQFDHPSFITIKAPQVFRKFGYLRSFLSWRDIYPLLYKKEIVDTIKQQGSPLSYEFVVSLIRQESAFNPLAVSSANANGLMQIIPSTAKTLANKLGIKQYDVFDPNTNIKMGVSLLNRLYNKYNGRLDYMLSAYNAGDGVTDRWIQRRGGLTQLQFIESIPYQETRNYIKLIFRNMEFYKLIYQQKFSKTG